MTAEQYHAQTCVSNTMLSDLNRSPAHCYGLHLDPKRPMRAPTDAMSAGTLAHTAILEPAELMMRYVARPDGMKFTTRDGMAWRDAQTLEIVAQDALDLAQAQRSAVLSVTPLRHLLSAGYAELSIFWLDELTGLPCKARVDWLHIPQSGPAIALDIKTISDLTPDSVRKSIAAYGYHRQHAHYSAGLRAVGVDLQEFAFGFVSSSRPIIACAYLLDDESMQQGREEIRELLDLYAHCKTRGEWPYAADGYQMISLPKWAIRSSEVEVGYADA